MTDRDSEYVARLEDALAQIRTEAEEQGGDCAPPAWCWVAELIDSLEMDDPDA